MYDWKRVICKLTLKILIFVRYSHRSQFKIILFNKLKTILKTLLPRKNPQLLKQKISMTSTSVGLKIKVPNFNVTCAIAPMSGITQKAMIHIDSDNFKVTSFLERFKRFIARSHGENSLVQNENSWTHKLVHYNDTFQANYDFSKNLLTMTSSYSLLLNGTERKISDVKITINFRFNQETHQKIILEDIHGQNVIPKIEHQRHGQCDSECCDLEIENCKSQTRKGSTILGKLLSSIVNVVEPIIVAFIHIVVNGILGHVLATAFDQLYNGRLITI